MLILFKISSHSTLAFLNTNEFAISRIKCHRDLHSLGGKYIFRLFSTCPSLFSGICWFWPSGHKILRRKTFFSILSKMLSVEQDKFIRWIPKARNGWRCLCKLVVFFDISVYIPLLSSLLEEVSTDLCCGLPGDISFQPDSTASGGLGWLERLWAPCRKEESSFEEPSP